MTTTNQMKMFNVGLACSDKATKNYYWTVGFAQLYGVYSAYFLVSGPEKHNVLLHPSTHINLASSSSCFQ